MSPPPLPPPPSTDSLLTPFIKSGDCNITLAAILSLLLVIFFVLLLHVYSKWFLSQSLHRNTTTSSASSSGVSLPHFLGSRFHHFHNYATNAPRPHSYSDSPIKGLKSSVVSSIPLFTHKSDDKSALECVVCLTAFENGEVGRELRNCGHRFHVDCIDMWLYSHSTCPICREPVIREGKLKAIENGGGGELSETVILEIRVENPESDNENVAASDSFPSSSSSSSLALSVKRMVIKNSVEVKVHSSTNVIELDA